MKGPPSARTSISKLAFYFSTFLPCRFDSCNSHDKVQYWFNTQMRWENTGLNQTLNTKLWYITVNPINTYHGLMKVNSGKTRARNDENVEIMNQIGLWWHPHKVVMPLRRDDPIFVCQIPIKVLTTNHWHIPHPHRFVNWARHNLCAVTSGNATILLQHLL